MGSERAVRAQAGGIKWSRRRWTLHVPDSSRCEMRQRVGRRANTARDVRHPVRDGLNHRSACLSCSVVPPASGKPRNGNTCSVTNTRHPAATLDLMATEDPRTPRPRHTPTPKSERPRCDDPDCSNAAYVLAHDDHRYCPSCFHRRTAVWRRENRKRGLCACGQEPTKDYKTCHRCRSRSALRIRRWRLRQQYGPPTHGWYTIGARAGGVTPSRAKQRASSEDSRHHPVINSGLPGHDEPGEARASLVEAMVDANQILYEFACIAYADITLLYDDDGSLLPVQGLAGRDGARGAIREGAGAADGGRGAGRGVGRAAVG